MKALVVDDHVLIREALRRVLKELNEDATVVEAADGREALRLLGDHPDFNLVLLDLNLPDRDGFAVLAELRECYSTISTVVLSAFNDRRNVVRAFDLGAVGFIPKSASRAVMLGALRLVFSGGVYIPPDILASEEASPAGPKAPQSRADGRAASPREAGLTERQAEVLALMMQGKSNKAICRILGVAEPTVKSHVTAILKSLKVTNRTEAVIAVGELGWNRQPVADR